jgi:hypothetical protein
MNTNTYKQGYIPKIQYWVNELFTAITPIQQAKALSKINYFKKRQYQKYGVEVSITELMNPQ